MKVLIVYDSVFGNTEKVARAMGEALSEGGQTVQVLKVADATPNALTGVDVLLVGSPTRAFSPTPATKSYVRGLDPTRLSGVRVAGFDTRVRIEEVNSKFLHVMARLFGYAAEPIAAGLRRKGGRQTAAPAGFFVKGSEGPLEEGELERAAAWAKTAAEA